MSDLEDIIHTGVRELSKALSVSGEFEALGLVEEARELEVVHVLMLLAPLLESKDMRDLCYQLYCREGELELLLRESRQDVPDDPLVIDPQYPIAFIPSQVTESSLPRNPGPGVDISSLL